MAGSTETATNIEDIIKKLKARGGREQMLMFLTGPAGSGKITAVMVVAALDSPCHKQSDGHHVGGL